MGKGIYPTVPTRDLKISCLETEVLEEKACRDDIPGVLENFPHLLDADRYNDNSFDHSPFSVFGRPLIYGDSLGPGGFFWV